MLSITANYALRALSCLAGMTDDRAVLGRDLAAMANVPANYLAKVLVVLKRAGFVEATRGIGGGYRLGQKPEDISLMQVVELFDPQGGLRGCLLDSSQPCNVNHLCPAHERWNEVKSVYRKFLETTTLAKVATADPAGEEECDV